MIEDLKRFFKGEISNEAEVLEKYSRDASLFRLKPELVLKPKDAEDIKGVVRFLNQNPGRSVTARAAGTDMTGGPLTNSLVLDVSSLNEIGEVSDFVRVGPGVFYRDLEIKTLEKGKLLPCYPASKNLCAIGGMVGNNCGGEKTLRYGKMEEFILESKYIFADGNEYEVKPLTREELDKKMSQGDFEGNIYKNIFELVEKNKEILSEAKPKVSKNSSGYFLWNLWHKDRFDLNRLLVGSQGTLALMTEAKLRLENLKTHHDLVAVFLKSWDEMPEVINIVKKFEPESLETFDSETLRLGLRFMPEIAKRSGSSFFSFALRFLPEAWIGLKMHQIPELVILIEVAEETEELVKEKVQKINEALDALPILKRTIDKDSEEEKYWVTRRESFNLLREKVKNKRTAPFVEDFCIPSEKMPEFLPEAKAILEKHGIKANIAGHAGNGNFHIIPLMNLDDKKEKAKLIPTANDFYALVSKYKGTNSGEHNDGIVRTPYLKTMYSEEVLNLFKETKNIFDPKNIFNPGKKVSLTLEDFEKALF